MNVSRLNERDLISRATLSTLADYTRLMDVAQIYTINET